MKLVSVNLFDEIDMFPLAIIPFEVLENNDFVFNYLSSYFCCKIDEFNIIEPGKELIYVGNGFVQYFMDKDFDFKKKHISNKESVFYNHVIQEGVVVFSKDINMNFVLNVKDLMVKGNKNEKN